MFRYLQFVFILLLLAGCTNKPSKDDYDNIVPSASEAAVFMYLPDTGISLFKTIKPQKIPDYNYQLYEYRKGYFKNFLIYVYPYEGIDIEDTASKKKYFLRIIGATNIDGSNLPYLKVKSSIGEATLLINGSDTLQPISFDYNYNGWPPYIDFNLILAIKEWGVDEYNRPDWRKRGIYFFECPTTDKVVYGWKKGEIETPVCHEYHQQ
ncbi:MAG: hypothetical protein V4613_11090 [Bacteroidota bacterium]